MLHGRLDSGGGSDGGEGTGDQYMRSPQEVASVQMTTPVNLTPSSSYETTNKTLARGGLDRFKVKYEDLKRWKLRSLLLFFHLVLKGKTSLEKNTQSEFA